MIEDVKKYSSDIFKWVELGISYYAELFGKEYPFSKYDHVFVPDHSFDSMYNVGCVTFDEKYLFKKEKPSTAKYAGF